MTAWPTTTPNQPDRDLAHEVARTLMDRFVNRTDIWGLYKPDGGSITAPARERRGKEQLTLNVLHNHASGAVTIGAPSTSPDDTCKSIAFDIDAHNDAADPEANWRTTLDIVNVVVGLGLEPIVEHSNGKGGYHVWCLFSKPIPSTLAYRLAKWIKRQAGAPEVESFPKQMSVKQTPGGCGNYLRMPGRHHKRPWWSQFWDADSEQWLAGADAVAYLLEVPVNDPEILSDLQPLLPPDAPPAPAPEIANPGVVPICVTDLLQHSIRRSGQRNVGALSLLRYFRAANVSQQEAEQRVTAWMRQIPSALTSADLTGAAIEANVASVAAWVYGRQAKFDCFFMHSLGTPQSPVACNVGQCLFIRHRLPERRIVSRPIPASEIPLRTEVPIAVLY